MSHSSVELRLQEKARSPAGQPQVGQSQDFLGQKMEMIIMEIRVDRLVLIGMKKLQHYWLVVEKPI